MRTPIRFMQTMFVNGPVLAIWIALLLAANMVAPLLFITRPEGQVVLGAAMVEKHVTLSRADGGPDAAFSLEPDELAALCRAVNDAWQAVGRVDYGLQQSEREMVTFRRSLYVVADMRKGEALTPETMRSIRPGFGLAPKHYEELLGKRLSRDVKRGTPLDWNLVA